MIANDILSSLVPVNEPLYVIIPVLVAYATAFAFFKGRLPNRGAEEKRVSANVVEGDDASSDLPYVYSGILSVSAVSGMLLYASVIGSMFAWDPLGAPAVPLILVAASWAAFALATAVTTVAVANCKGRIIGLALAMVGLVAGMLPVFSGLLAMRFWGATPLASACGFTVAFLALIAVLVIAISLVWHAATAVDRKKREGGADEGEASSSRPSEATDSNASDPRRFFRYGAGSIVSGIRWVLSLLPQKGFASRKLMSSWAAAMTAAIVLVVVVLGRPVPLPGLVVVDLSSDDPETAYEAHTVDPLVRDTNVSRYGTDGSVSESVSIRYDRAGASEYAVLNPANGSKQLFVKDDGDLSVKQLARSSISGSYARVGTFDALKRVTLVVTPVEAGQGGERLWCADYRDSETGLTSHRIAFCRNDDEVARFTYSYDEDGMLVSAEESRNGAHVRSWSFTQAHAGKAPAVQAASPSEAPDDDGYELSRAICAPDFEAPVSLP